jgi:Gaa1-like, GPI transamidase component
MPSLCMLFLMWVHMVFTLSEGNWIDCRVCLFSSRRRVVESTLRSANNLLERLHASFFFYIQTTPRTFLKVGHYLPAVIVISVATMFGALSLWVDARWVEVLESSEKENKIVWCPRDRPVLDILGLMTASHVTGYILWYTNEWKSRFPVSLHRFYSHLPPNKYITGLLCDCNVCGNRTLSLAENK